MNSGEPAADAGATKHITGSPFWEVKQSWDARTLPISAPVSHEMHDTQGEQPMARSVAEAFPHLTEWVRTHGWIEIGYDDYNRSFITDGLLIPALTLTDKSQPYRFIFVTTRGRNDLTQKLARFSLKREARKLDIAPSDSPESIA